MTDIKGLRAAMHAAVDGEQASADELIRLVMRRHRRHRRHVALAGVAALIALAVAVPVAIAVHDALLGSGPGPSLEHPTPRPHRLPAKMTGLPVPTAPKLQLLVPTYMQAGWYSTAARRTEAIGGLRPGPGAQSYGFGRLDGGWWAMAERSCSTTACAPGPQSFYFIADGSLTATLIGKGYAGDGANPASRTGAVWLVTYPAGAKSVRAQLVSTTGRPLGPRYTLPAGYLLRRGVGSYLLLFQATNNNRFLLWDPRTGRVVRRFGSVIAAGPEQIAWTAGCRGCRVRVLNVPTGNTVTTPIPGGQPANLTTAISDDGTLLAVQPPGGNISVVNTSSGALTIIPGTATGNATWQNFGWLNGSHQLIVTAGPNNQPGPAQVASWQPGDTRLRIATIHNRSEITRLQKGTIG
jgi:hypothetical protein